MGGLRRDELGEARRRLDNFLGAEPRTRHGDDELEWRCQLRSVLWAARAEGTDLVVLYR